MTTSEEKNPFVENTSLKVVGWAFFLITQYLSAFISGLVLGSAIFKSQKGIPVWEVLRFWLFGGCALIGNTLLIWYGLKPRKLTFIFLCGVTLAVFIVMFLIGSTEEGYYDTAREIPPFRWINF